MPKTSALLNDGILNGRKSETFSRLSKLFCSFDVLKIHRLDYFLFFTIETD